MSLHRAVALLIVAIFMCGAASPSAAAYAATVNSTAAGTVSVRGSAEFTWQSNGDFNILVIRTGGSSGAAAVLCKTVNNTAVAGRDYTAVSATLHWAGGDTTPKNCTVPMSDAIPFSGTRTFFIELSGATGAALGSSNKTTVTIHGNKHGGTVSVSAPTYTVAQNAGHVTITVHRTGGSLNTAAVHYATADMTAIAGTDYTPEHGRLIWENADATPKSFSIPISNAKPFTGTKTLAVAIVHATNAVLGSPTSTIVTIDGDRGAMKPVVTIEATPTAITSGSGAILTWKASNATTCTGSGAWSGTRPTSGSTSTGRITSASIYTLTCSGAGGTAAQSATVKVAAAAPIVTLSASPSSVTSGGRSTLAWSSTNATSCTASGAWTGAEPTSGSQSTRALTADSMYALTCTGIGGSAAQSATVSVKGAVTGSATLTWTAPTTNTDGSPLTDLSGYHIYYGTSPSALTQSIAISSATTTSYVINALASGTWYFAIAADASDGTESAKSAAGSKTI